MTIGTANDADLDRGTRDRGPVRTCIATRETGDPAAMIRFVRAPDGSVVPDLKGALPGRGAWVSLSRERVEEASRRNLFARAFRTQAAARGVADEVDRLLAQDALARLALAKKAGALVSGFVKCDAVVREGRAVALVHASDAGDDGVNKLAQAVRATDILMREADLVPPHVATFRPFDTDALSERLGLDNAVHLALRDDGAGRQAAAALARLERYRGTADPPGSR